MLLHETTISGVYQHQLKRAPTPREYQLSIQDPTCRSQHQLRCEESNPQVQDPACRQKTICPTCTNNLSQSVPINLYYQPCTSITHTTCTITSASTMHNTTCHNNLSHQPVSSIKSDLISWISCS
jgi:hypothetical protein